MMVNDGATLTNDSIYYGSGTVISAPQSDVIIMSDSGSVSRAQLYRNKLVQNSSETAKKFFTFDVSTSIRGLHQKKLVLGLLLPVLGAIS